MSTDLQHLFEEAALTAPSSTVDTDEVVRRGRRLRARRRRAAGGALLGVGAAVAASAVLVTGSGLGAPAPGGGGLVVAPGAGGAPSSALPSAPVDVPGPVDTTTMATADPGPAPSGGAVKGGEPPAALAARFAAVTLPDPAPGFPVRRWTDELVQESVGGGAVTWSKLFGLAVTPGAETSTSDGGTTTTPTGPEITLRVSESVVAGPVDGRVFGNPVDATSRVTVAGVEGTVSRYSEEGTDWVLLSFRAAGFHVEVGGNGEVTDAQLVALGEALTGLS